MKKKILITGVSGFIGGAMARHARSCRNFRVLGVDLVKREGSPSEFFCLDLLARDKVFAFLKKYRPQVIFHFAGGRISDPQVMFEANVMTTQVLLGAVVSIKGYHPRVVVAGTAAEYGVCPGTGRITEGMSGKVEGQYGLCKSIQTRTALYFSSIGADVVVARPFNVLGPGLPAATVGGAFARDLVLIERGEHPGELEVGNLMAVRDFLDIRDICAAFLCLVEKGRSGEIYNVCSQKGVPIRKLLEQMLRASRGRKIIVREDEGRDPGVLSAVGSCAKMMKETGWRPRYSFGQSVADTLEYYRSLPGGRE